MHFCFVSFHYESFVAAVVLSYLHRRPFRIIPLSPPIDERSWARRTTNGKKRVARKTTKLTSTLLFAQRVCINYFRLFVVRFFTGATNVQKLREVNRRPSPERNEKGLLYCIVNNMRRDDADVYFVSPAPGVVSFYFCHAKCEWIIELLQRWLNPSHAVRVCETGDRRQSCASAVKPIEMDRR